MTQDQISISAARYIEVVYDIKIDHLPERKVMSHVKKMAVSHGDNTLAEYLKDYDSDYFKDFDLSYIN